MASSHPSEPFRLPRISRVRTRHREPRPRWSHWLAKIALAALILLAFAGPWMTIQGADTLSQFREIGYVSIAGATLLALRPWRHPERLAVVPWPLLLALGWCAISLLWAIYPSVGLRRLLLTAIVIWSLFALVRDIGVDRSVMILRVLLAGLLVVNLIVVLAMPAIGIHPPTDEGLAGDWRGIMGQKNWAGMTCAVTVLLLAFDAKQVSRWLRLFVSLAAVGFLVMTRSATSLGMGVAALLFGGLVAWQAAARGGQRIAASGWAWVPFGIFGAIVISMAVDPAPYLGFVSDPSGFTGRFLIWTALIHAYVDRAWLGFGYGSFWDLGPNGPSAVYAKDWVADVGQGHNGYLDLLVQIGGPGTMLLLFATVVWPIQRLLRGSDHPARPLAAAMLLFCLGHNFTETTLFDRDGLGEVFLMFAIALLWGGTAASTRADCRTDGIAKRFGRRKSTPEPA